MGEGKVMFQTLQYCKKRFCHQENRAIESKARIYNPERPDLEIGVGIINISDADINKDEGYYECEATNQFKKQSSDKILIKILGKLLHVLCQLNNYMALGLGKYFIVRPIRSCSPQQIVFIMLVAGIPIYHFYQLSTSEKAMNYLLHLFSTLCKFV